MAICRARKGVGLIDYLPCLILLLVTLWSASVSGHGGNHDDDTCVPWICSCYYRSIYFDEGDVWDADDDPCTKFKCMANGVFLPIKSGCSFKGECHKINSTWSEGCFRYSCHEYYSTSVYRLEEAACVWNDGACYAVGQRVIQHCDEYECQIIDGCYAMVKVKSGCIAINADTPCKPLFSFWTDRCSVFQCVGEDKDRLRARIQTHTQDAMMWPRGHYALPAPLNGCPNFGESFWLVGSYKQCGDGCNFKSYTFSLLGNYTKDMFDHHFCVHHDFNDPSIIPVYQTYWESGRYCILRHNGTCPKGFSGGFIMMTNKNCSTSNITNGVLPDGKFDEQAMLMEFCCRYDGEVSRPIVLPTKHPFVLFVAENETECQQVQGMHERLEFWSFCDSYDGMYRVTNGSLPLIKTGDNNTLINYCYYDPVGCGCTDDDERAFAVGDQITEHCVTKECQKILIYNVMIVTKGGCLDDGMCRDENETWTEMEGESCQDKKCVRITGKNKQNVTFEIIDTEKGCRDGSHCVPLNYTKESGCYATQCQVNPVSRKASFKLTLSGCSDGHGHCIPDGQTFTQGCVQMKCDKSASKCGLVVDKGGCGDSDKKCYDVGEEMLYYCSKYVCREKKTDKYVTWRPELLEPGCTDSEGTCYKEGDRLNTSCAEYECLYGDTPGFYPIWAGCRVNFGNGCILPNQKMEHGCSTYNCTQFEDGTRKILREKTGCSYEEECYDAGSNISVPEKCLTYHCGEDGRVTLVGMECRYHDHCYAANKEFKDGCSTYMCFVNSTYRSVKHVQLACKVDGKCIDPGVVFKKNCHTYKCSEDKESCASHLIEYGCADPDTKECLKPGDTIRQKCSNFVCQPNGTTNPFKFSSSDCIYNDQCIKQGGSLDTGKCESIGCNYKVKGDTSSQLVLRRYTGCMDGNECLPYGHATWDKTSNNYYCFQVMCLSGTQQRVDIACKDENKDCITLGDGEQQQYTLLHGGMTCSAMCTKSGSSLQIKNVRC